LTKMDQPEEILEKLERFNVQKNPEITRELDEYVSFVARTGESVFNWALVKKLYREKLINVITDFYNETPTKELPQYPNVDPFNYETMKKMLIERLDSFSAAPFTIQRISELLADPRKQYSRIDKFMRAVEKNILVVSTVSPGRNRSEEKSENGDSLDSVGLNGDFSSDVNVDIDMENDGSFTMTKEFNATTIRKEPTHDITTESQETVTIKKVASKEEEATTSTIAASNGEPLEPTQTEITIENSSTVTITVCEPTEEPKSVIEEPIIKSDENVETIQKAEESVIKSDIQHEPITLLTENVEPKIDDALLNEPLRPADDEILPENPETTPLAALENIVANRVEVVVEVTPRIEEQILPKQEVAESKIEDDIEETPKEVEQEIVETEQKIENVPEIDSMPTNDDSGIETKRIRIEAIEEVPDAAIISEEPQIAPVVVVDESAAIIEEPQEVQPDEKEDDAVPENTTIPAINVPTIEPVVEIKEVEDIPVVAEPIIETKEPESIPSPVIVEPTVITEEPIIPAVEGEMEAVPSNIENNMALDEDVSAAQIPQIPQEIPEMEMAQPANKMDTDDNESENVLMDTDDTEEPMDQ
ncbi:serine/threonine-protein phosphatase 4 regulatory subunit 2, partial [Chironomus tepperi]|uniref:serine/threonine-protein phosphatase 4 regulatory subunit 2 n=1 Tax=Chironomus tepperi TaxID=113505 RepID=UPI00391FC25D